MRGYQRFPTTDYREALAALPCLGKKISVPRTADWRCRLCRPHKTPTAPQFLTCSGCVAR
jgi:hypothetical protein